MTATPAHVPPRDVPLQGTRNFRDLGGIPTRDGTTRYGVVFRSDRLTNLTPADATVLGALNVATIVDLRSNDERERAPNRLPPDFPARQVARAFNPRYTQTLFEGINSGRFDAAGVYDMMLRQYDALAVDHIADYRRFIDDLLYPGALPLVFHCTSGKDRTGMMAAILLLAVGADPDAVVADYVMTQGRIERVDIFAHDIDDRVVDIVMAANHAYIGAAFSAMSREFGSIESYLTRGIGISPTERARLVEILIDGRA